MHDLEVMSIMYALDVLSGRKPAPSGRSNSRQCHRQVVSRIHRCQATSSWSGAWIQRGVDKGWRKDWSGTVRMMAFKDKLCDSRTTSAVMGILVASCRAQLTSTTATRWTPAPTLAGPRRRGPVPPLRRRQRGGGGVQGAARRGTIVIGTFETLQMSCRM